MQTRANLTPNDLKKIIKDSVRETLSVKKLKGIFYDVIEDISLSKAIDESMNSESNDKNAFFKKAQVTDSVNRMDIQIKKSFSKDVDKIHNKKLLNSIFYIITQIRQAASIKEIKHVKKM